MYLYMYIFSYNYPTKYYTMLGSSSQYCFVADISTQDKRTTFIKTIPEQTLINRKNNNKPKKFENNFYNTNF